MVYLSNLSKAAQERADRLDNFLANGSRVDKSIYARRYGNGWQVQVIHDDDHAELDGGWERVEFNEPDLADDLVSRYAARYGLVGAM